MTTSQISLRPFCDWFLHSAACCEGSPVWQQLSVRHSFSPRVTCCVDMSYFIYPSMPWWMLALILNDGSAVTSSRRPFLSSFLCLPLQYHTVWPGTYLSFLHSCNLATGWASCCLPLAGPSWWVLHIGIPSMLLFMVKDIKVQARIFSKHPCCFHSRLLM